MKGLLLRLIEFTQPKFNSAKKNTASKPISVNNINR